MWADIRNGRKYSIINLINFKKNLILPKILVCCVDHDTRVRYFACESLYNVVKCARTLVLQHFEEIFDVLSRVKLNIS